MQEDSKNNSLELNPFYLRRSEGIFVMAQHYWTKVLKKKPIGTKGARVAFIGCGDASEALPFTLALEGKARKDVRSYLTSHSLQPKIQIYKLDYDTTDVENLEQSPKLSHFLDKRGFVQADFRAIPAPENTFDVVVMRNPFWDDFEDKQGNIDIKKLRAGFDELLRVLKNDGTFWMTFLSSEEYQDALRVIKKLVNEGALSLKVSEKNPLQTVPGINPKTGEPWPWDKYIIIAEKSKKGS